MLVMPQTGHHVAADAVCTQVTDLVPLCSEGHMQHRTVLCHIQMITLVHAGDLLWQLGALCQLPKQLHQQKRLEGARQTISWN